jgi:parallel beta-helix repeat protein
MSSGRLSCGDKITRNTTLTADVGPCPTTGIIIGADNITLNLNGHTISGSPGPGNGNAAGIRLPFRSGVTITGLPGNSGKTGTVTGFDAGVLINGGSNNTVEKLVVLDNVGPLDTNSFLGDGIAILHSSANRIVNNLVAHNGKYDGIAMLGVGSDDNLIQGNVVEGSTDEGLGDPFNEGFTIGYGTGVIISPFLEEGDPRRGESVHNNTVIDNLIRQNVSSGISSLANVGGVIKGNTVEGNGFRADGSGGNSPGNGIAVQHLVNSTPDTFNLIEDNEIHNNAAVGILILNSHENRVVGNRTSGNGFDLGDIVHYGTGIPCERNTWFGNSWAGVTGFEQYGSYYAECTSAGGTGPRPSICALFNTVDDPGCVPLEE